MEKQKGKKILGDIVIGKVFYNVKKVNPTGKVQSRDEEAEIVRYEHARNQAKEQLRQLQQEAVGQVGELSAQIFEVYAMLLEDGAFNESIYRFIREEGMVAQEAVKETADSYARMFLDMDDEYLRARYMDIRNVSKRVISILNGSDAEGYKGEEPIIFMTKELSPGEILRMDKEKILAIVTEHGSLNSHGAILARTMGIPALTGVPLKKEWHGKLAVIDGEQEEILIDPDETLVETYQKQKELLLQQREFYLSLKGKESVTKSGQKINLLANIGSIFDLPSVIENDAEGIGLLRTEFLYMGRNSFPTEEEQFKVYRKIVEAMGNKKVIIRTLDIGADKQVDYFHLEEEENPVMGYRAIRLCLERPEILKTQLRAIYRAAKYGNISVLYPMINAVEEIHRIKDLVQEVKADLEAANIPYGEVKQGIMIETPAAAMISDLLTKEVDFFSIGTNDLTQYTLAIDRQNAKLEKFYNPYATAVLRLLEMVVRNAHQAGIPVGICGEIAADTAMTETFLNMGVDELSVSPNFILPLRNTVREVE